MNKIALLFGIIATLGCRRTTEVQCKWRADTAYAAGNTIIIKQFSCR